MPLIGNLRKWWSRYVMSAVAGRPEAVRTEAIDLQRYANEATSFENPARLRKATGILSKHSAVGHGLIGVVLVQPNARSRSRRRHQVQSLVELSFLATRDAPQTRGESSNEIRCSPWCSNLRILMAGAIHCLQLPAS